MLKIFDNNLHLDPKYNNVNGDKFHIISSRDKENEMDVKETGEINHFAMRRRKSILLALWTYTVLIFCGLLVVTCLHHYGIIGGPLQSTVTAAPATTTTSSSAAVAAAAATSSSPPFMLSSSPPRPFPSFLVHNFSDIDSIIDWNDEVISFWMNIDPPPPSNESSETELRLYQEMIYLRQLARLRNLKCIPKDGVFQIEEEIKSDEDLDKFFASFEFSPPNQKIVLQRCINEMSYCAMASCDVDDKKCVPTGFRQKKVYVSVSYASTNFPQNVSSIGDDVYISILLTEHTSCSCLCLCYRPSNDDDDGDDDDDDDDDDKGDDRNDGGG